MFPNNSFISPFLQLINALEVVRNGRPKIIGNELHASIDCVSKTIKSTGYVVIHFWVPTKQNEKIQKNIYQKIFERNPKNNRS